MSTASIGRSSEYLVRDDLITHGWEFVMRAAASKGAGDLLMGHPLWGAALIQVGRKSKTLGPADRDRLCTAAELIGALPLLATHIPRNGITYHQVTRDKPSLWAEWSNE
jgi:hypothetical protein